MVLLAALCGFSLLFEGFTNRSLRALMTTAVPGYTTR